MRRRIGIPALICAAFCCASAVMAFPPAEGRRNERVWNAEYREAATAMPSDDPGRAAMLMMAGEYAEAIAAGAGIDPLARAVALAKLERWREALDALEKPRNNPLLERYRLYWRARACGALGLRSEAAAACATYTAVEGVSSPWLDGRLLDVVSEVLPGSWDRLAGRLPLAAPSARTLAHVAAALLDGRDLAGSADLAAAAGRAGMPPADRETAGMLCVDSLLLRLDLDDLGSLVELALGARNEEAAFAAAGMARDRFGAQGRLLEARVFERTGSPKTARRIYARLHHSREAVAVKRDALIRMAAIALRLGDHDAASLYRTFGMYYPDDPRSAGALDTSARIEIARNRPLRAIRLFAELRGRAPGSYTAGEAAIAEAVLLAGRGDGKEAERVLLDVLERGDRRLEAPALYWLGRAAGSDRGAEWRRRLVERHPSSAYALLAAGQPGMLIVPEEPSDPAERIASIASAEHEAFEVFAASAGPTEEMLADPVYGAWRFALNEGLADEAAEIGEALLEAHGGDEAARIVIYREARSAGLVPLALRAAAGIDARRRGRNGVLWPVAYAEAVTEAAAAFNLPPELILAVAREESLFDRNAVSSAGAMGLMQLMPATAAWIGGKTGAGESGGERLVDPVFSLRAGAWYLRFLLDRGDDSIVSAAAAYNAGHGKMRDWRKTFIPSHDPMAAVEMIGVAETRRYVRRVLDAWAAYRGASAGKRDG
ncbi:MAG: lytic transglycosylase domain-containing protein [Candidatus Krumholzibacteriota bacterium]|nr:lytic transglycosylase domain-containing protein [Candidatus Krumholzibacteriota bacterium]